MSNPDKDKTLIDKPPVNVTSNLEANFYLITEDQVEFLQEKCFSSFPLFIGAMSFSEKTLTTFKWLEGLESLPPSRESFIHLVIFTIMLILALYSCYKNFTTSRKKIKITDKVLKRERIGFWKKIGTKILNKQPL